MSKDVVAAGPVDSATSPMSPTPRSFEGLLTELAAGLIVAEGGDLDGGIETALGRVVDFYGADRSTLFRHADGGGFGADADKIELVPTDCATRPGIPRLEGILAGTHFPATLEAVLAGESVFLDPHRNLPAGAEVDHASCRALGIDSVIAAPLVADGLVVGAVAVGQLARRRSWTDAERIQLGTIASLLASAVARRRSHAELASARGRLEAAETRFRHAAAAALGAQEDERRRIARELHDDVTQRLVSLSLELESVGVPTSIADETRALAEAVHGHGRRLHPRLVESLGLRGAVEAEVEAFEGRFANPVDLRISERGDRIVEVPFEIASVAYRVLQEALRNVLAHADASRVEVRLGIAPDRLRLGILDDGCGFVPESPPQGLGLASMRERVALASGRIEIETAVGRGVRIEIVLPLVDGHRDGDDDGEDVRRDDRCEDRGIGV